MGELRLSHEGPQANGAALKSRPRSCVLGASGHHRRAGHTPGPPEASLSKTTQNPHTARLHHGQATRPLGGSESYGAATSSRKGLVSGEYRERERERERERARARARVREREPHTHTHTQTHTDIHRHTETQRHTQRHAETQSLQLSIISHTHTHTHTHEACSSQSPGPGQPPLAHRDPWGWSLLLSGPGPAWLLREACRGVIPCPS